MKWRRPVAAGLVTAILMILVLAGLALWKTFLYGLVGIFPIGDHAAGAFVVGAAFGISLVAALVTVDEDNFP